MTRTMNPPISAAWVAAPTSQYALWIDGVGGYLLCLANRVTLGQPADQKQADLPIVADLSRQHATIQREAEGYFLEAARKTQVNGQAVEKMWLRSGDRVTLGRGAGILLLLPSLAADAIADRNGGNPAGEWLV